MHPCSYGLQTIETFEFDSDKTIKNILYFYVCSFICISKIKMLLFKLLLLLIKTKCFHKKYDFANFRCSLLIFKISRQWPRGMPIIFAFKCVTSPDAVRRDWLQQ